MGIISGSGSFRGRVISGSGSYRGWGSFQGLYVQLGQLLEKLAELTEALTFRPDLCNPYKSTPYFAIFVVPWFMITLLIIYSIILANLFWGIKADVSCHILKLFKLSDLNPFTVYSMCSRATNHMQDGGIAAVDHSMSTYFKNAAGIFFDANPLSPAIKLHLLSCVHTFLTEVVERIC